MGFSYGKIIVEICKVVKQRYHLTQSSATERKTSEVQTQQQIEMTPFQKVSDGEVQPLSQSQGNVEAHEIKIATTEATEHSMNEPKMDNDTKQVSKWSEEGKLCSYMYYIPLPSKLFGREILRFVKH